MKGVLTITDKNNIIKKKLTRRFNYVTHEKQI